MKKIFVLLLSLLVLFVAQVNAQETIKKIQKRGELIIGTSGKAFPFTYKDKKTGELMGIDILIAKALAKEMGVKAKFKVMDFDKLLPAVSNGDVDIALSALSITTKRNMSVAFANSYYYTGKALLSFNQKLSKGNPKIVNNDKVTLAAVKHSTSEMFIKNKYPKAKIVPVESVFDARKLLIDKKIDGIVTDFEVCEQLEYSIKDGKLYYQNLSKKTNYEYYAPAVSPKDYLFLNLVNNFIKRVNAFNLEDEVEEMWLKYLNE